MNRKRYVILAVVVVLLALVVFAYKRLYKDHRNIATEKALIEVSALQLENDMGQDAKAPLYIDKAIKTHGSITAIEKNSIMIDDRVQANFANGVPGNLAKGSRITVKGRCVGYDDLLEIVKIDQAIVIE